MALAVGGDGHHTAPGRSGHGALRQLGLHLRDPPLHLLAELQKLGEIGHISVRLLELPGLEATAAANTPQATP